MPHYQPFVLFGRSHEIVLALTVAGAGPAGDPGSRHGEPGTDAADLLDLFEKALALDDQLSPACNNLAWMLASHPDPQIRNGKEAVDLAEHACRLTNNEQPVYLGTLAAAYAEAGRFSDAIATAEKARDLARKAGLEKVAERNEQLLEFYRAGRPYHEPADAN